MLQTEYSHTSAVMNVRPCGPKVKIYLRIVAVPNGFIAHRRRVKEWWSRTALHWQSTLSLTEHGHTLKRSGAQRGDEGPEWEEEADDEGEAEEERRGEGTALLARRELIRCKRLTRRIHLILRHLNNCTHTKVCSCKVGDDGTHCYLYAGFMQSGSLFVKYNDTVHFAY